MIEEGKKLVVEYLMQNSAELDVKDEKSNTPLHTAAEKSQYEIIQLLSNRITQSLLEEKNGSGYTAQDLATFSQNKQTLDSLLEIKLVIAEHDSHGQKILRATTIKDDLGLFKDKEPIVVLNDDQKSPRKKSLSPKLTDRLKKSISSYIPNTTSGSLSTSTGKDKEKEKENNSPPTLSPLNSADSIDVEKIEKKKKIIKN